MSARRALNALAHVRSVAARRQFRAGVLALLLLLGLVVSRPGVTPAAGRTHPMRILSGWSPYWNPDTGPAAITAMGPLASSASSFSYSVFGAANIGRQVSLDKYGKMRAAARAAHIPFVPALADATGKLKMQAILADPTSRAAHVNALVSLAVNREFDGIDLDYEGFAFSDGSATWATTKPLWTQFIIELAAALHAEAKLLFVTVPPTYNNNEIRGSGYWVYNLPGIAPYVDRIRIMAYDYSTNTMGPNAPLSWTQKIVNYVADNLPPSKVELGVPLFGRDWITGAVGTCPVGTKTSGKSTIRTSRAITLAKNKNATPTRLVNGEMRFSYTVPVYAPTPSTTTTTTTTTDVTITDPAVTDPAETDPPTSSATTSATSASTTTTVPANPPLCTVSHTVYYPDAGSTQQKVDQALAKGLAGVVFFALGYEEARHFQSLRPAALAVPHAKGIDPIGSWTIAASGPGTVSLKGWALDPESSLPIVVRVSVDGKEAKRFLANEERTAVGTTYPGNGPFHGGEFELTVKAGRHRVCVQALGVGAGRTARTLKCRTVRVAAPPPTTTTTTSSTTTSTTTTTPPATTVA